MTNFLIGLSVAVLLLIAWKLDMIHKELARK